MLKIAYDCRQTPVTFMLKQKIPSNGRMYDYCGAADVAADFNIRFLKKKILTDGRIRDAMK